MTHPRESKLSVTKSLSGVAGATVTMIVLIAAIAAAHAKTSPPSNGISAIATATGDPTYVVGSIATTSGFSAPSATSESTEVDDAITASDGFIAADATLSPFDVDQPAVGNLNRNLLSAIQHAATDAANDGIEIRINSGWRSARYQQYLLNQAVIQYGSEREARKWVSTPEQSAHVAGDAVDIAPIDADDWLLQHGNQYGLCQIYANEIWHFELDVEPGGTCPPPKADASEG